MSKTLLVVCLLVAGCWAAEEDREGKNLATTTTSCVTATSTTVVTTTSTTTSTRVCGTVAAGISACRKRRGIEEKPVIQAADEAVFAPSQPIVVEATPVASLHDHVPVAASADIASSKEAIASSLPATDAEQRFLSPLLTITFLSTCATTTATSTATVVSTATVTSTKFTISGCLPGGIAASIC